MNSSAMTKPISVPETTSDCMLSPQVRVGMTREKEMEMEIDPQVEALVTEMIGRIADKWTMVILNVLEEQGEMRFSRLATVVTGISQKMLTKTVRQMERDGLLTRTVYPVVPPKVVYKLTELGLGLSSAFCGVWVWAEQHYTQVEHARQKYDEGLTTAAD